MHQGKLTEFDDGAMPDERSGQDEKPQDKYITLSYIFSEEEMAKTLAQVRAVGGSLIVTIPKKIVDKEGIHEGEWVQLDVKKAKKDYFGCLPGVGSFTKEDEFTGQLD